MPVAREARGIVSVPLADFSGGFTPRLSSTEFTDRQWARLEGVVFDSALVLRSQWALQPIGATPTTAFQQVAAVGDFLLGIKTDGTVWYTTLPGRYDESSTTREKTWTEITAVSPHDKLRFQTPIPLPDEVAGEFTYGVLLNTVQSHPAYAIYQADDSDTAPSVKEWTNREPDGSPTDDAMPRAGTARLWGDYLVLGNIWWTPDGGSTWEHYEHSIWFSQPGKPDSWDPVDVVHMTPTGVPHNAVRSMEAIDSGLMVFSDAGVFLLRGLANDHSFEEVRWNAGPVWISDVSMYWAHIGGVVWVDTLGQVWETNGDQFRRIDDHLFLPRHSGPHDHARGWGEYMLVERDTRLLCFRAFDGEGAWTELVTPSGSHTRSMYPIDDQMYFVDNADGRVWRYNRSDETGERGQVDGSDGRSVVAARTVESGAGHTSTMWHRFGFRASGPGSVVDVTLRPGPALDSGQPTLVHTLNEQADERHEQVVPGHGPSVEASAEVRFDGDVAVEQFTWWHHRGKGSR